MDLKQTYLFYMDWKCGTDKRKGLEMDQNGHKTDMNGLEMDLNRLNTAEIALSLYRNQQSQFWHCVA